MSPYASGFVIVIMSINYSAGATVSGAPTGHDGQATAYPPPHLGASPIPAVEAPPEAAPSATAVPGLMTLDVSWSMTGVLAAAYASIEALAQRLRLDPSTASVAYIGMITFADTAVRELGLSRIADPNVVIPQPEARGATNYHAGLAESLAYFRDELPRLKAGEDGVSRKIWRPTLYWISDGHDTAGLDWRAPLAELRSRDWAPNIMAFGFGDADRSVIGEIADEGMAFFAEDGAAPHQVFDAILAMILKSMVSKIGLSRFAAANPGAPAPVVPTIDPATDPATRLLTTVSNFN